MRPKLPLIRPTDEEDAAITAAAINDPDAMPLSDDEWMRVKLSLRRPSDFSVRESNATLDSDNAGELKLR